MNESFIKSSGCFFVIDFYQPLAAWSTCGWSLTCFFSWDVCVLENFPTSGTTSILGTNLTLETTSNSGTIPTSSTSPASNFQKKYQFSEKLFLPAALAAWASRGWIHLDIYQTGPVLFFGMANLKTRSRDYL